MRRMAVQNAFQVLSIFYLFVTCFCSSLNVDTNVNGVLPSEGLHNDSVSAPHVNKVIPEDEKVSSSSASIVSSDGPPKVEKDGIAPDPPNAPQAPNQASETKTVAKASDASATSADAGTNTSELSSAPVPPPASATSNDKVADKVPTEKSASGEPSTTSDGAESVLPTGVEIAREKKSVTVGGRRDPDNTTVREHDGEPPEDGSDVPTFDEYQRKFTSGGNPAKDGAAGGSGNAGDAASNGERNAAKVADSGGGKAVAGGAKVSGGSSRQQSFKNIGSHNCGAKVISHNNEASNPAYVLNENRDEYMNNPCAVKKWIVVETCEPVRLRKIEMASYELFSSMVKTFRVSSSERFPQKMWDVVGTFVAKNEKGIQTYPTEQEKYYKYFKFEFVDHYGNEHFCPVSLIRLFGVLMEDDDGDDDAPDDNSGTADLEGGGAGEGAANARTGKSKEPASRSLLQSAKEVIVGIVQNTLRPSTSKEGTAEDAGTSNASLSGTGSPTNASLPPAVTERIVVEGPRVMHLMRLLLSGDYSGLLQRCLELLRQAPPVVHQNYVEHKIIPSPSVAFAACAKAVAQSKISADELRWAYLTFNNATFPWEDSGGSAAITAKLGEAPEEEETSKSPPQPPPVKPPSLVEAPAVEKEADKAPAVAPPEQPESKPAAAKSTAEAAAEGGGVKPPDQPANPPEAAAKAAAEPAEKGGEALLKTKEPVAAAKDAKKSQPPEETPPQAPVVDAAKSEKGSAASTETAKEKEPDPQKARVPEQQKQEQIEQKEQQKEHQKEQPKEEQKAQKEQKEAQAKEQPKEVGQKEQKEQKTPQKVASSETSNGRGVGLKENAYMRLSNKVKDMERNITISMGYLEELSRSYKKKTDKLSKQLEKALSALEETRALSEKQESRLHELEARVKTLRETYEGKGLLELRKEHARMAKETWVQTLALNFLIILLHSLVLFICRTRCRRPSAVAVNGAMTNTRSVRSFRAAEVEPLEARPLSHSNSDSNLCIVDPPFRFDDNFVKKDSKKRRKKKKSSAGGHQMPDRSASVSRIEQLIL